MQDSIIGYLLGALEDDELAQFEAQLENDPQLQAQVREAARSLQVLRYDDDDIEPPQGLTESTCAAVEAMCYDQKVALSNRFSVGSRDDSWTLVDFIVACSVLLAACLLFFPAVNSSRYHAQVAGCQNNLRSIGRALAEYSSANSQGLFPQVPETGNLAVAGMYAPTLKSFGFVTEDHNFFCPSSPRNSELVFAIPNVEEVKQATGQTLEVMQLVMGGDYGYSLGVIGSNGQVRGIRNRSRSNFALMSDSPNTHNAIARSDSEKKDVHRNVLFESGCVRAVCNDIDCWYGDQLYKNDDGKISAGVHDSDAVIGASNAAPIVNVSYVE